MYAIIAHGGKQYKVCQDDVLQLEKIEAKRGAIVEFKDILMIRDSNEIKLGRPYLLGVKVLGKVVGEGRKEKINILKFKRRKHHLKRSGHRQNFTLVKITDLNLENPETIENS